jgi:hypothetical protein
VQASAFTPRLAAIALLVALPGCAGDTNPVRDAFVAVGAASPPPKRPDFVQKTRPEDLDYIPISKPSPVPPPKARTAAEVQALEAELEAARARNQELGASVAR